MLLLSGCRVLVVENEAILAMMIEDALLNAGAEVIGPAAGVDQALALLERRTPTCAVLDLNLKGELSVPVAYALAALGVPFVIASSYSDVPGLALPPAAAVVAKPYDPASLIAVLNRLPRADRHHCEPVAPGGRA